SSHCPVQPSPQRPLEGIVRVTHVRRDCRVETTRRPPLHPDAGRVRFRSFSASLCAALRPVTGGPMAGHIIRRLARVVVSIIAVSIITFALLKSVPGSFAELATMNVGLGLDQTA